jgi:hypothetical protein
MSTSNNEHDDFIQELIENIYISLELSIENENKKEKFKVIIKGVVDFLKDNELSTESIRTGLIEFFHLRRSYIKTEYDFNFYQIGVIVEGLIAATPDEEIESNLNNESSASVPGQLSGSQLSSSNELYNLAMQLLSQPTIPNYHPIVYTYQPYMHLPTVNIPTTNIVNSTTEVPIEPSQPINPSNIPVHNLNSYLFNIPVQNLNNDNEEDEMPPLIPHGYNNATTNLLLNFVNIYLNNASMPPLAPMVDVKNVVTEKQLEQLKVATYSDLKTEEAEKCKDCAICLDSFEKDSKLRILKCEHGFHVDCIDKWLTDCNYKCPVCRDDSNEHHAEI